MQLNTAIKWKFSLTVQDEGDGFELGAVVDPRFGESLYKPGGRGLLLMRSYMDVVKFNDKGNSMYMVRYREKPHLTKSRDQKRV